MFDLTIKGLVKLSVPLRCILLTYLLFASSCASNGEVLRHWPAVSSWPLESWQSSTPEAQGMDPGMLAAAVEGILDENLPVHGILVVRNGFVVLDVAFAPFQKNDRHDVASVTKSVTATLVGMAITSGELAGLDQPISDFFPELAGSETDVRKKAITIRDLLTMRSGLDCEVPNAGDLPLVLEMIGSDDWVGYALGRPMSEKPGERFRYCSLASHLLAAVLRKATGISGLEYAKRQLFEPLGMKSADWPVDPATGDPHGWGDLMLTRYDMARIGYLYLSDGRWGDRQLVSPEWVRAATRRQAVITPFGPVDGYGYHSMLFIVNSCVSPGRKA